MPRGVCRAGRRGKNGLRQGWPSPGGMQRCVGYERGGRRTARTGWVPNQSQSGSAGGSAGVGVIAARQGRQRETRRSSVEWRPCREGTACGYDDE